MRFSSAFLMLASLLILMLANQAFAADKRVALVIGNSVYQRVSKLTNPSSDAAAIATLLKKAGFDIVESRRDLTISDMRRAIRDFSDKARDADIAVVFYAGHGMEVDGVNYLLPVDAALERDIDVEDEAVSLDRIIKVMEPVKRLRLVILDACRDNPFTNSMKRTIASRSIGRGLAKVEVSVSDTMIAFAAKAGSTAADGDGKNSPFTAAIINNLTTPGLDLRIAFGRVRDEVLRNTGNRQEPFMYGSLGGDTVALVPPTASAVDQTAAARQDYEFAAQIGTKQAWSSFLAVHATGLYADLARAQYNKLQAAELASSKAEEARRLAEEQAKFKAEDFRRQLEEQGARQAEEVKQRLTAQAKRELDEARRQVAENSKRELDEARRQVEEAKRQADEARRQVEEAKRQAVDEAREKVEQAKREGKEQTIVLAVAPATQTTSKSAPVSAVPAMDPADIGRLLQAHLKRVGCDPEAIDGNWGDGSKKALTQFNNNAGTKFNVKVASLDALDGVRAKSGRVCPLMCGKGQRAESDRCIQISCDKGFMLGSDGACRKRPAAQSVVRQEPSARTPAASAGGAKCFTFNGKRFCE